MSGLRHKNIKFSTMEKAKSNVIMLLVGTPFSFHNSDTQHVFIQNTPDAVSILWQLPFSVCGLIKPEEPIKIDKN